MGGERKKIGLLESVAFLSWKAQNVVDEPPTDKYYTFFENKKMELNKIKIWALEKLI